MGGVRFVSIIMAIVAVFLWGGFVVNAWQNNLAKRTELTAKTGDQAKAEVTATLDRADEMAVAASKEFSKLTDKSTAEDKKVDAKADDAVVGQEKASVDLKEDAKKPVKVDEPKKTKATKEVQVAQADAADDKSLAPKVVVQETVPGKKPVWTVPAANDPIDLNGVGASLKKMADNVKDGAETAAETVGEKVSSLAGEVKDRLTGHQSDDDAVGHSEQVVGKEGGKEGKLAAAKTGEKTTNYVVEKADAGEKIVVKGKLENRLGDDTAEKTDDEQKDTARLSKDLVAVPVKKYADKVSEADGKVREIAVASDKPEAAAVKDKAVEVARLNPEEKQDEKQLVEKKEKPVWVVPTGQTPDYGIAEQIGRGLDRVKEAASKAGDEIAGQVSALGENVKEVVSSAKKWEVPTGVTWGEDKEAEDKPDQDPKVVAEKVIAGQSDDVTQVDGQGKASDVAKTSQEEVVVTEVPTKPKDVASPKVVTAVPPAKPLIKKDEVKQETLKQDEVKKAAAPVEAPKIELPVKKAPGEEGQALDKTAPEKSEEEKSEEKDSDVAAQTDSDESELFVSSKVKRAGDGHATGKGEKAGEGPGVVARIINFFSDGQTDETAKAGEKRQVSSLEKVRLGAIKELMVEQVGYEFTDKKKGEGVLKVSGRSQVGSKLALYVGPRYLGDVTSDGEGKWAFEKDLFLPQGQHIVHAQQMSKGGSVLARKTKTFVQQIAGKAPKGYEKSIGISQGDKGLAFLKKKLSQDNSKPENPLFGKANSKPAKKSKQLAALQSSFEADDGGVKAGMTHYIVKPGDTLSRIAHKVYGNAKFYKKLVKLNSKIRDAHKIYPGQKLLVSSEKAAVSSPKPKKDAVVVASVDKKAKISKKPKGTAHYVVKPGDSLWIIAKKVYGNGGRYKEIIALNPVLAKNPQLIRPKMKLRVQKG